MPKVDIYFAAEDDSEDIYFWEFHPSTRKWMRNKKKPAYDQHLQWIRFILYESNATDLMIAKVSETGNKVAVIRLDYIEKNKAEVGITVSPFYRGRGIGKSVLLSLISKLKLESKISQLTAEVDPKNKVSIALFESVGFKCCFFDSKKSIFFIDFL